MARKVMWDEWVPASPTDDDHDYLGQRGRWERRELIYEDASDAADAVLDIRAHPHKRYVGWERLTPERRT